jgi:hypothetical protein
VCDDKDTSCTSCHMQQHLQHLHSCNNSSLALSSTHLPTGHPNRCCKQIPHTCNAWMQPVGPTSGHEVMQQLVLPTPKCSQAPSVILLPLLR